MAIQIVKTFAVKAPREAVWSFLIDPRRVASCMPGAAITGQVDDRTFTGTMTVKVGPVTTSYKGKVVFERLDAQAHAADIVASGQDVKGKGGANMKLSSSLKELGPGETEITSTSDLTITGILAQMGRGMIQDVSDELFQIFSRNVRDTLEGAHAAEPEPEPEAGGPGTVDAETETRNSEAHTVEGAARGMAASARAAAATPPEALDIGGIGARAARRAAVRMLGTPTFWIVLAAVAGLVYLLFLR
jgi:uncharacterized protein